MKGLFYIFLAAVIAVGAWLAIQYFQNEDCPKSPTTGECVEGYGY